MAEIENTGQHLILRFSAAEKTGITQALDYLEPKIGVVPRTSPHAYQDLVLEAEYRRWTLPEIQEGRRSDIALIRSSLTGEGSCVLDQEQTWRWIRALNHLRLAAAGELGIRDEDWLDDKGLQSQPAYQQLVALTWLQEQLTAQLGSMDSAAKTDAPPA